MKRLALFLLLSALLHELPAQTETMGDEYVLMRVSDRSQLPVASLDFLKTATTEEAWKAFKLIRQYEENNPGIVKKAGRMMAENPAVEKYVTEEMAKLPHHFSNEGKRSYLLAPLGNIPAPWSVRLLGSYLKSGEPMILPSNPPSDYGSYPNWALAIEALKKFKFSDAPAESPHGLTPDVRKAWVNWWKDNEGRVEERILEINPGYRLPVSATPAR